MCLDNRLHLNYKIKVYLNVSSINMQQMPNIIPINRGSYIPFLFV